MDDSPLSRARLGVNGSGLLTPADSVIDLCSPEPDERDGPRIYNGYLQYKEGSIIAKKDTTGEAAKINTRDLPTPSMVEEAARTPVNQAEAAIRGAFDDKLRKVPKVRLENQFDSTTPNLNFDFIDEYILREGVSGNAPETFQGCQKCKPDASGNIDCGQTARCDCLEFAAVDLAAFKRKDPEMFQVYQIATEAAQEESNAAGEEYLGRDGIDTAGMPKRAPYTKPSRPGKPQTMNPFYLEARRPIYECNVNCKCGPGCHSRLVQKGRRVPLVIFKTGAERGWGVYCEEDLFAGEFIDVYLGEVITDEEAGRRESSQEGSKDKLYYLYSLDKFVGDRDPTNGNAPLKQEDCYVVDGQYMGNVTRFMNNSCEPNVRQYTVSYNKHDLKLYSLAFFANQNIPAGRELVFDYLDSDPQELDVAIRRREAALVDPDYVGKQRCFCGSAKCRGFLWDKEVA